MMDEKIYIPPTYGEGRLGLLGWILFLAVVIGGPVAIVAAANALF